MHNPASPILLSPSGVTEWFDARNDLRQAFLRRTGWAAASLRPVGEDCAFRRYFRLSAGSRTAILMEAVPDSSAIATPGHNMKDFIRIGAELRRGGLNTPEIYEADDALGYIVMEDFGGASFKKAMQQGQSVSELYGLAVDVLARLRNAGGGLVLPDYYQSHVHKGRRRVVDWFIPALKQARNPDGLAEAYLQVWDAIERDLPPCPQGFLHIDYHVENLMWLPERQGTDRCGILDFQGAMRGPQPYDLANLLEDAREEITPALRSALLDRFTASMAEPEARIFRQWYRVLATQFHCRVIGQFIRLAVRDNKPRYLEYLPRLAGYLREGLKNPVLAPLKDWFTGQGVDFTAVPAVDPQTSRFIRDDAF